MGPSERAERLQAAGLKVTGPRLAILDAVERNRNHPSAEEIHQGLAESHPSVSLSTVYSTLGTFVRAGLVRKLSEVDGRLRVDGTKGAHDHAICRMCGVIFDIDRDVAAAVATPTELPGGLAVLEVRVEYDVVCSNCRTTD
ncbi:MAG: transcriptional repressor [Acidobacteria bacterium]|jgi:Fe2+ or Zn2+ uptake regulation protein|nr:transcriptional repressor [Acidobacteriota bacterium]MDP7338364.1 Fur family transcriptional regulator [Vicinamibacterales bacterium]MDP7480731.1 Fur family transcriptional regulator [Vicinamibacterales bacterium]MDP7690745.1 Fur family transcriptional regulator [Vicinamibacterales bacterium]HJN43461.1 Fur family transcriptional regulator [Vicinamibacterales bacterium]|tara:strand:- start:261 stop:683 length:423 start_codon:yes stop_codon:yes gene_type:complete